MPLRTKDSYQTSIYDFTRSFLVVCPSCSGQAIVKAVDEARVRSIYQEMKLVCTSCGYNNHKEMKLGISFSPDLKGIDEGLIIIGTELDPYFHLPLWLKINCCSNTLWAYNYEHLDFLETFVTAKLRERNTHPKSNSNLGSRLPRWITSQKNREAVLKAIEQLKMKE